MEWVCVNGEGFKKAPEWIRCAGLSEEGIVFVPAAIFESEKAVFFRASYDGVGTVICEEHLYVPALWAVKEYPDATELCMKIDRSVRERLTR